jgi:hypothetical protein
MNQSNKFMLQKFPKGALPHSLPTNKTQPNFFFKKEKKRKKRKKETFCRMKNCKQHQSTKGTNKPLVGKPTPTG